MNIYCYRLFVSRLVALIFGFALVACKSSDIKDAIDVAQGFERSAINRSYLGINAFVNDTRFGSPGDQFDEIKNKLRLQRVRVLIAWNSAVQNSPNSEPFWGFYDSILGALPEEFEALLVVTGLPEWMKDPANWTDNNPRLTFAQKWVRPVLHRYGSNRRVTAIQVWNEPNMLTNIDNTTMAFATDPEAYVELLALARNVIDDVSPRILLVSGATTALNQNFPSSLDYNRAMRDYGATSLVDIWGAHVYGRQKERFLRKGGVIDFISGLSKPVWVTESGAQGVNEQLRYGEEVWPFLKQKMPSIERIYIYQFTDTNPPSSTYGLRNLDPALGLSDLYIRLRDSD